MVLRRSTTDCARLMARRRALRSMLSFIAVTVAEVGPRGPVTVARNVTLPICGERASAVVGALANVREGVQAPDVACLRL